ncbi:LL-diaminopimelate aminotransferase apoenzyme [Pseudobutyrivibrio sp. ACV-2]|uniref:LL-diaminopimelate aminotransferase n=1 Tax=Pseudobutyrivibrio sp. ACV-2 TaxID=1520801 RepID=UPI00089BE6C0|nr:LL-diaminopimelate aminotransferase [Pseudobutyrivibrio sp. ACV-2]SEA39322.1 LL-diaminopimelate aminotransferase apoenzyme [Pseudobutyrivibrio sp. ACV-2]
MFKVNTNFQKLPGSYLFSTIAKKVAAYSEANPNADIIRLGIGDVTQPIAPAMINALHSAVDEMGAADSFHGYAPDLGYPFLRETIAKNDYRTRGCDISADEIFVSDGAKSDSADIQELFAQDVKIAVCDPVYPVYVDSNVMAGRLGTYDETLGKWSDLIYMPTTADNKFVPEFPKETPDVIYLCLPNNPTGTTLTKSQLQQWVDYANKNGSLIIFDAAYEAYISEADVPHSIYECTGSKTCAIEIHSFSKNAGFTGVRLGYTVVPKDLVFDGVSLHGMWARRHGTKFNGAPYIIQRAGEAVYSPEGQAQIREQVGYYMNNAKTIYTGLKDAGFEVYGGVNAPYIWLKTPQNMTSWDFFDYLLEKVQIVGTPGAGFGPSGEGYFRLTAFGSAENTVRAIERIKTL